jgi:hypothetical protein
LAEEKVPQALPVQAAPLADQLTPALSLVVDVSTNVWPITSPACWGEKDTVIGAGGSVTLMVAEAEIVLSEMLVALMV